MALCKSSWRPDNFLVKEASVQMDFQGFSPRGFSSNNILFPMHSNVHLWSPLHHKNIHLVRKLRLIVLDRYEIQLLYFYLMEEVLTGFISLE